MQARWRCKETCPPDRRWFAIDEPIAIGTTSWAALGNGVIAPLELKRALKTSSEFGPVTTITIEIQNYLGRDKSLMGRER